MTTARLGLSIGSLLLAVLATGAAPRLTPRTAPPAQPRPATCADCDDHDLCTEDSCNPDTVECEHAQIGCNDDNDCTDDVCDSVYGCLYLPAEGPCYVADPCMLTGVCSNGTCHAEPRDCSDGNPCTDNTCVAGQCVLTPRSCDDGNACTDDSCDAQSGNCLHVPDDGNSCTDGNPCTLDHCSGGACSAAPRSCDDGVACTADGCNPGTGACTHVATGCDDGNPCTTDSCNDQQGCVHGPAADGTACTNGSHCWIHESCLAGVCQGGESIQCQNPQDSDPCHWDTCNRAPGGNCERHFVDCGDGNSCTQDACTSPSAQCMHSVRVFCADGCEVQNVRLQSDRTTLVWSSPEVSCSDPQLYFNYQLARGPLSTLPSGGAATLCQIYANQDPSVPPLGGGFWYLVRAWHETGLGTEWFTWGWAGVNGSRGAERHPSCP